MVLVAEILDVPTFRSIMMLMCKASPVVKLMVDAGGIKTLAMNSGMTALLQVELKRGLFATYKCSTPIIAYLDSRSVLSVVRGLKAGVVMLEIDENAKVMRVIVESNKESKVYELSWVVAPDQPDEMPDVDENYKVLFMLPIDVLSQVIKDIKKIDSDDLDFSWNSSSVTISSKRDVMASFEVDIKGVEFLKMDQEGKASFLIKFLEDICNSNISDVTIGFIGSDSPIMIRADTEKFFVKYLLAPFIRDTSN